MQAILGTRGDELVSSGDPVADQRYRRAFLNAFGESHHVVAETNDTAIVVIGKNGWPMPIPLVKSFRGWRFDTPHGVEEIVVRRIGRNELAAIQVCLAILAAAHEYAALDLDADGIPEYTPRFISSPGRHDGLYWPTKPGEPLSPLGPLLAAAAAEGYGESNPLAPYHGYFYRILTKQGQAAPGGAREYMVRGEMIAGFAVIAYPAEYGVSGIMTFMASHDGAMYETDLGKQTAAKVSTITEFNPDERWSRADRTQRP
jgi:hypothetical protein